MSVTPEYVTLSELSKTIPGRPSAISLWRWCRQGLKTRDGGRLRLKHVRCGRRLLVRPVDAVEFCDRLAADDLEYFSAKDETPAPAPRPRSEAARRKDAEAAHARCEAAGL